jgi:RND family efflux transporter MFP subunit
MSPSMVLGRLILPAIGIGVVGGLIWGSLNSSPARTQGISLAAAVVKSQGPARGQISAEGRVVAYPGALVTLGTEVLGTVIRVSAAERAAVRKGDLLVELRSDDVKASLREAHSRLIEAETSLRLLRSRFQLDKIFPSPTGKTAPPDTRTEEQAAAVARRDAAKAAVDRLEAESAKYRITAPLDGVIIGRMVNPGETVTPGSRLLEIADLSRTRVEAEVDEFDIAGVTLNASVVITAEGYSGRGWRGVVEEIPDAVVARQIVPDDPGRPSDTRVLRLKIAFRERHPLKLGQRVEVAIATK